MASVQGVFVPPLPSLPPLLLAEVESSQAVNANAKVRAHVAAIL
jgi:hypothetical protein